MDSTRDLSASSARSNKRARDDANETGDEGLNKRIHHTNATYTPVNAYRDGGLGLGRDSAVAQVRTCVAISFPLCRC